MTAQEPIPLYTSEEAKPNLMQKPRIFVEYSQNSIAAAIEKAGYSVKRGSLGRVCEIQRSGDWCPLKIDWHVPDAAEQEILFLSLKSEQLQGPRPIADLKDGALAIWQSCKAGLLDTKPPVASLLRHKFDEIFNHGGMFVLELAPQDQILYQYAESLYKHPKNGDWIRHSSWDMLSVLDGLDVDRDEGSEIRFANGVLGQLLAKAAEDASYTCVLGDLPEGWTPLAYNKRGKIVSAAFQPPEGEGLVLLIPTMPALPSIIPRLFSEIFPMACPSLFPNYTAQAWVHDERYESSKVLTLQDKRRALEAKYLGIRRYDESRLDQPARKAMHDVAVPSIVLLALGFKGGLTLKVSALWVKPQLLRAI